MMSKINNLFLRSNTKKNSFHLKGLEPAPVSRIWGKSAVTWATDPVSTLTDSRSNCDDVHLFHLHPTFLPSAVLIPLCWACSKINSLPSIYLIATSAILPTFSGILKDSELKSTSRSTLSYVLEKSTKGKWMLCVLPFLLHNLSNSFRFVVTYSI